MLIDVDLVMMDAQGSFLLLALNLRVSEGRGIKTSYEYSVLIYIFISPFTNSAYDFYAYSLCTVCD